MDDSAVVGDAAAAAAEHGGFTSHAAQVRAAARYTLGLVYLFIACIIWSCSRQVL